MSGRYEVRRKILPNCLLTNARSILRKTDELGCVLRSNNIHVGCVTESWLDEEKLSAVVDITGYVSYRRDRQDGRVGGGVVCYVREDLPCTRVTEFERQDIESLWLMYRNSCMPRNVSH